MATPEEYRAEARAVQAEAGGELTTRAAMLYGAADAIEWAATVTRHAVLVEREACAAIAESAPFEDMGMSYGNCRAAAEAIRARSAMDSPPAPPAPPPILPTTF